MTDQDNEAIAERREHGRKVLKRINELNRKSLARAPAAERAARSDDELQALYKQAIAEKRR